MKIPWSTKLKKYTTKSFDFSNIKVGDLKELYSSGKHKELAKLLPHARNIEDVFVKALFESRLLTMGEDLETLEVITFGADPEFILKSKETGETVLFSSEHVIGYQGINMSEATLGADYGLLEMRPEKSESTDSLIDNIADIMGAFNIQFENVAIDETEAKVFDHKKERIRSLIENKEVDFGVNVQKIYMGGVADIDIGDETTYMNKTLSAYDEPLMFQERPDLLTAGGHIHVGGTFVRMLSIEQLKFLIRTIDEEVYDLCCGVESPAGELRREVYGYRGEFRVKPYGMEYRTPSNAIFWQKNVGVLKEVLETINRVTRELLLQVNRD